MILHAENLSFHYGKRPILRAVSGKLETGKVVFLLGENGSGKTTLLKLFARLLMPQDGKILLDGQDVTTFSRRQYAARIGAMSQTVRPALDLSVEEFCRIGRNAKLPRFGGVAREDAEAVKSALQLVDLEEKSKMPARALSGGEFQRLRLAATLALRGDFLLLDEPVSAQDPPRARQLLSIVHEEKKHCGILVIAHDLELATTFADEIWLLSDGELFAQGTPETVLTAANLARLYHCEVTEAVKKSFAFVKVPRP